MADKKNQLTPKQEAFAQAIADGMRQAEAYRLAYNAEKMKAESVHVNASKLMADAKVAQRVDELKAALAEKALWKREDSVAVLSEVALNTHGDAKYSERVSAVKELNAMHGYNEPAKIDITSSDGSMAPKIDTIRIIAGDGNA